MSEKGKGAMTEPLGPLLTMSEEWMADVVIPHDGDASADFDILMGVFQVVLKELAAQRAEVARLRQTTAEAECVAQAPAHLRTSGAYVKG